MKPYLITYNYGQQTHFAYTNTVEEARTYAADLLTHGQVIATDSLSIIRVADEYIVFFKADNLAPDSLYVQPRRRGDMFDRLKALIYGNIAPTTALTHQAI